MWLKAYVLAEGRGFEPLRSRARRCSKPVIYPEIVPSIAIVLAGQVHDHDLIAQTNF